MIESKGGLIRDMSDEIYAKGDWLLHSNYGIGQVKGKVKRVLDGEKSIFFKVKTSSCDYFILAENWDVPYIRRLSSENEIIRALSILRKAPKPLSQHHKERHKQILDAASDISINSKARMIRDLYGQKRTGKLNYREKSSFERIINEFLREWSIVSDIEIEVLREKLYKALYTSFSKVGSDESWLESLGK